MATFQKRKLWSDLAMVEAVECVASGKGLREAARLYNVPVETLRRRVNGTVMLDCRPGPATVFTKEEEDQLVKYLIDMADMGYGLSRELVMRIAYIIAEKSRKKHPFTGESAGRSWFEGFRKRNPMLTIRTPQPLSYCRALCANPDIISDFFGKVGSLYGRLNLLSKPMQIFCADETGISVVHKPGKVVAQLGRHNVYSITSAERGKTHTVLACVSASGYILPPFMVYPRKRSVPDNLKLGAVPNTVFCNSENGWINSDLYIEWLKFFTRNIPPIRPVLLIQDGHSSHISISVIEFSRENGIYILCLPAHTTHILMPLDVGVFKSFKSNFSKACTHYIASHPGRVVTTDVLASLVAEAWSRSFTLLNIMGGFKKCGLFPFNPSAVDDRQSAPSKAFQATESTTTIGVTVDETIDEPSSLLFTEEQECLYSKRYEEGFDLDDPGYVAWLKINHPDKCVSVRAPSFSTSTSDSDKAPPSSGTPPSITSSGASCSSNVLSEVLVLPHPQAPKKKKKRAINSRAVCITDSSVLQELQEKEKKKIEENELRDAKKREREEKKRKREEEKVMKQKQVEKRKRERDEKRKLKEKEKEEKARVRAEKRGKKGGKTTGVDSAFADMTLDDSDDAVCPKCGKVYGEDEDENGLWICCDACDRWFDLQCTGIQNRRVPNTYSCEDCNN